VIEIRCKAANSESVKELRVKELQGKNADQQFQDTWQNRTCEVT